jgi:hypothetical protein
MNREEIVEALDAIIGQATHLIQDASDFKARVTATGGDTGKIKAEIEEHLSEHISGMNFEELEDYWAD